MHLMADEGSAVAYQLHSEVVQLLTDFWCLRWGTTTHAWRLPQSAEAGSLLEGGDGNGCERCGRRPGQEAGEAEETARDVHL